MNKRSRVWAILGAAVLTVGVVGIALAVDLKTSHQGITITWDENGVPSAVDAEGEPFEINTEECDGTELDEGQVAIHFVQSPTESDSGTLDVDFDGATDVNDLPSSGGQGSQVDWDVLVTATGDTLIIVNATSSIADGTLKVSHICVGENPPDETAPPSFEQSEAPESDEPSLPPSEPPSNPPSEPPSNPPSNPPSFEQSQAADTDAPSLPDTSAIGGKNQTGSPADGAWLLVVALGVLLASIVVLTPARARNR
jgi:hypothetical protein